MYNIKPKMGKKPINYSQSTYKMPSNKYLYLKIELK